MIVAGDDEHEKQILKEKLAAQFEMKDLGKLKYFLGIEVAYSKKGIFIFQRKYVIDLLKETCMINCKTTGVPIEQSHRIGSEGSSTVNKGQYQRLVGKLIYLAHTRLDIVYVVSVVSQFMHDPRERHLQVVNKILQYLKKSPGRGLLFKRNEKLIMEVYTDADYEESIIDRKSTSGYCMFLSGNLVTWKSKKQNVVARSSVEAEFRAMAQGVCELLWMRIILNDLQVACEEPMILYCDNKSVISIAHNPVQHDRTKYIEIDRHFIKEKLDSGLITTSYIPSGLQLADLFTKGLPTERFHNLTCKLRMIDIHSPA